MKCPFCGNQDTRVIDSRPADDGATIRRRRVCDACKKRFTTYEKVEQTDLMVIKRDGSREIFNRAKVRNGILMACRKRPVTTEQIDRLVDRVEAKLHETHDREVPSSEIGEVILDGLRGLDEVAYVRFASVYRHFDDVKSFIREIENLTEEDKKRENKEK